MPAPGPSTGRRLALALGALVCAAGAFLFAITWFAGVCTWPPGEETVARRLGTAPEELAALLAKGDASKPLRIGVVGDIQNGVSELGDLLDSLRDEHVDFILQLGDAANAGHEGRYAVLRRVFEEHAPGVPVIAVPGNHDVYPQQTTEAWTRWVGPAQWRLDVRGWRILGIDDSLGPISDESMDLLRAAAKDAPPRCGTIVVAHRPLAAHRTLPEHDPWEPRAKQLADSGVAPAATISGHWHTNDAHRDEQGVTHYLVGENCDRASSGADIDISKPILTLSPPKGGAATHDLSVARLPRRMHVSGEFLRLAVGSVYPALRPHGVLAWLAAAAGAFASWRLARAALRRAPVAA
jgi:predicted phosphodiesterase